MCVALNDPRMQAALAQAKSASAPADEYGSTKQAMKKKGGAVPGGPAPAAGTTGAAVTQDAPNDPTLAKGDGTFLGSLAGDPSMNWEGKDRVVQRVRDANAAAQPPELVDPTDLNLRKLAMQARRRLATTDGIGSTFLTGPQGAKPRGRY